MGVVITFVIALIQAGKGAGAGDVVREASVVGVAAASVVLRRRKSFRDHLRACCQWRFEDRGEGFGDGAGTSSSGVAEVAASLHGIVLGFDFAGYVGITMLVLFGFKRCRMVVNENFRRRRREMLI